jgi:Na+/proline symporter
MSALPSLQMYGLPSGYENREFLAGFTALCLVRVILGGMGTGNESRYFAARDDRACGLQSLIQGVMIAFRWPMMMGFAILGIVWLQASPGTVSASTTASVFAEQVIPVVLQHSLSPVARGIVLAALLGAMMSTLACGLNSAAATCVRDLYQHRLRPHAGGRELMIASYLSSLLLAALGFWAGVGAPDLNRLWGWLVMGLMTGSCGPMFLRLYWWRCNASGSVIGIICGISGTFIYHALGPSWGDTWPFIITAGCSFAGTIIGSLLTAPVPGSVLKNFFLVTRPFGVWGGYKQLLREADRLEHRRDLCALPFVMLAQICLFLSAMQLVLRDLSSAAISIVICLAAALCVWRIWGRYLYKSG